MLKLPVLSGQVTGRSYFDQQHNTGVGFERGASSVNFDVANQLQARTTQITNNLSIDEPVNMYAADIDESECHKLSGTALASHRDTSVIDPENVVAMKSNISELNTNMSSITQLLERSVNMLEERTGAYRKAGDSSKFSKSVHVPTVRPSRLTFRL